MFNAQEYHLNYASVKARGVSDDDSLYTLTVHKCPVRKSGYETVSTLKIAYLRSESTSDDDSDIDSDIDSSQRFANSIVRSKQSVIQLIANNPWEYFVTLTVSSDSSVDRMNLKDCKAKILQFFTNYSKRSGAETGFKYLLIPEEHKNGAWHFHGVMMGINPKDLFINKNGYLDFRPYSERFGYISFSGERKKSKKSFNTSKFGTIEDICSMGKIRDLKKCASYMSKYMTKEMFVGGQMTDGSHLYFSSKGLKRDKILITGTPVVDVSEFLESGYKGFQNEYCIKVEFDDKETALGCVIPFPNYHKMDTSVPTEPLKSSKRNEVIRKKIEKLGIKFPFSKTSFTKERTIVESKVIKHFHKNGLNTHIASLSDLWTALISECPELFISEYDKMKQKIKDSKKNPPVVPVLSNPTNDDTGFTRIQLHNYFEDLRSRDLSYFVEEYLDFYGTDYIIHKIAPTKALHTSWIEVTEVDEPVPLEFLGFHSTKDLYENLSIFSNTSTVVA